MNTLTRTEDIAAGRQYVAYLRDGQTDLVTVRRIFEKKSLTAQDVGTTEAELIELERQRTASRAS